MLSSLVVLYESYLTHVHGIQRDGTDEPRRGAAVETQMWQRTCGHSAGGSGCDEVGESHGNMCPATCEADGRGVCCVMQGPQTGNSVAAWGGGGQAQEGGDTRIPVADSCCWVTEANTTL